MAKQPLWVLIIEDKPLYAAAMATHLDQWGASVEVASSQQEALASITNQPPCLMLINVQLVTDPHLLKAVCPCIKYEIHDGSRLRQPPIPEWTVGSVLMFPCSVELFKKAVETALACRLEKCRLRECLRQAHETLAAWWRRLQS